MVKSITEVFNNQFNIDKKYLNRTTRFFTLDKNHNPNRVFDSIVIDINSVVRMLTDSVSRGYILHISWYIMFEE